MWAAHEVRARIVDVHREVDVPGHPPVATITLQPTSTWQGHRAGQHVQLGVEVEGARRTTRVFTISSPDSRRGDRFTVTLRANPAASSRGSLSSAPCPARWSTSPRPQGEFVLPDLVPEHVLFISGGSGITPVMSMLRSLQRRTHRGRVTFVHYAQSPEHQIFAAELDEIRRSGHGIDLHLLHPELGDPKPLAGISGAAAAWLSRRATWACGPAPLIEAVRAAYEGRRHSASSTSGRRAPPALPPRGPRLREVRPGGAELRRHPPGAGRGTRAEARVRLPDRHLLLLHFASRATARSATS